MVAGLRCHGGRDWLAQSGDLIPALTQDAPYLLHMPVRDALPAPLFNQAARGVGSQQAVIPGE